MQLQIFLIQFPCCENLTTAEGGALVWNLPFGNEEVKVNVNVKVEDYFPTIPRKEGETWNDMLYRISQLLSLHGQNKDALAKTQLGAWEYDVLGPWYKCNMTDIMAGIGLAQFSRYQGMLARRRHIISVYNDALKDLPVAVLNHYGADFAGSGHLYITRLLGRSREDANKVIEEMAKRQIACNVHYKPLPMMTAYKSLGFDIDNYPNAYHCMKTRLLCRCIRNSRMKM